MIILKKQSCVVRSDDWAGQYHSPRSGKSTQHHQNNIGEVWRDRILLPLQFINSSHCIPQQLQISSSRNPARYDAVILGKMGQSFICESGCPTPSLPGCGNHIQC